MMKRRITGGMPPGTITLFLDAEGNVCGRLPSMGATFTSSPDVAAETLFHGGEVRFPNNKPEVDRVRAKLGKMKSVSHSE